MLGSRAKLEGLASLARANSNRIVEWLLKEFRTDTGMDVSKDKMVLQRLKDAAETAKKELSSKPEAEINLPFLTADATGPKHMVKKLSRAQLEKMMEPVVGRALEPLTAPAGFDWRLNIGLLASFGARELMVGTLGVIGPTRMAYDRMIEIVDITSRLVSQALSQK